MEKVILKNYDYVSLPRSREGVLFEAGDEKVECLQFILPMDFYVNKECALSTFEAINSLLKTIPSISKLMICNFNIDYPHYDYKNELGYEEFFYKHYEKIEHPEKIFLPRKADFRHNFDDGSVFTCLADFSLSRCKNVDDKINLFINDIKNSDLSQFEKIMATHILCSRFIDSNIEKSKEDEVDIYSSVFHVLSDGEDGYQIRCTGYTDLFCRMLNKMDIDAVPLFILNKENKFGHVTALVDVHDEKYDINGRFICDVRADADLRKSLEEINGEVYEHNNNYYYGEDCLAYFCLNCNDYELSTSVHEFNTPVLYTTQTGKIDEKDKVSTERISIGKIGQALAEVSSFRYDISNMDIFASNESDNLIKRDYLRTLYFLSISRNDIDNIDSSAVKSNSAELNHMLNSSKMNAIKSSDEIKK